jgi:hypothetical protein
LPWLLEQLAITETRQDRLNLGIIGARGTEPSVVNWGAARLAEEVHDHLTRWTDMLCEQFGLQFLPALSVPTGFIGPLRPGWKRLPRGYSGSSAQRIAWLFHHAGLIARHAGAADIYRGLITLTGDPDTPSESGRLVRAINRSLRVLAGMCPTPMGHNRFVDEIQCGLVLYAEAVVVERVLSRGVPRLTGTSTPSPTCVRSCMPRRTRLAPSSSPPTTVTSSNTATAPR